MVKLCLTLAAGSAAEMQEKIRLYDGCVPLIEIRLDYLDPFSFPVIPAETETRYLATCRPAVEGGKYRGSERDRLRILREAPGHRFSLVDLESDTEKLPPFPDHVQIVRSSHDFSSCPQDLRQVYLEMKSLSGDLVKLVVTPQNTSDLVRLLEFMENNLPVSPGIIIGMGHSAQVTRIIGPFLGSAWTYVSEDNMGVAPGQFGLDRAVRLYRLPERGCVPDLYGVTGRVDDDHPDVFVDKLNLCFRDLDVNAMALPLPGIDMGLFLAYAGASKLPYRGFVRMGDGAAGAGTGELDALFGTKLINGEWSGETAFPPDRDHAAQDIIRFWMS